MYTRCSFCGFTDECTQTSVELDPYGERTTTAWICRDCLGREEEFEGEEEDE